MTQDLTLPATQRRQELAHFLQVCRRRLNPEEVGLPSGHHRRTKGLRREEVAALVGISLTWYTWLEQGRDIQVSRQTLERLAQVLQLDEAERAYLSFLALPELIQAPPLLKPSLTSQEDIALQKLLVGLQPAPALLRNHCWDILAWNAAEEELTPWPTIQPAERNFLIYIFTHPHARAHLPEWSKYARGILQIFRLTWSQFPSDERMIALISYLQEASPLFRQWWQEHAVQQQPPLEVQWQYTDGLSTRFSILYLTFPLFPLRFLRVLFPPGETLLYDNRPTPADQST